MTDTGHSIRRAAVIGAGTMGAGIAALLARAGLRVDLLDVVPDRLGQPEIDRGLSLASPEVRNRIARDGWARARASRPVDKLSPQVIERVSIGNIEDDLGRLERADWIIEAVVEDLSVKRQVMAAIEAARGPASIVSTNTSGITLRQIGEGRTRDFGRHFLGTHFFNPPMTMKLIELIPGPQCDPAIVQAMQVFLEGSLKKGVVLPKDTPNFIANRVATIQSSFDMDQVLSHGHTVDQADAILGPVVGRPSTAVFRLRDLVGLDVSTRVAENLYRAVPNDAFREILVSPRLGGLRTAMIERGMLGRKSGGGFYRARMTAGGRRFLPLDLKTFEYVEPQPIDLPTLAQASGIDDLPKRLRLLVSKDDPVGHLVWASLSHVMTYAAYCIPEIADELHSIDRALRWGYSWQMGPFEIWDALGVPATVARMKGDGALVADWVDEMLLAGNERFYKNADSEIHVYSPIVKTYIPLNSTP
jgi:3-hydroxyacyl-CoA dehydrogenase